MLDNKAIQQALTDIHDEFAGLENKLLHVEQKLANVENKLEDSEIHADKLLNDISELTEYITYEVETIRISAVERSNWKVIEVPNLFPEE